MSTIFNISDKIKLENNFQQLLLNNYSGAAAAYSLRRLDGQYSGSAVRVRRASDSAEQDIAFVNNELDTATLENFASGTDAFVTTWYDQSGNGVDAENANASSQPQIVSSGSTILENGKPAISFVGINAYLATTGYIFEFSQNDVSAHIVKSASDNLSEDQYMFSEQDADLPYSSQFIIGDTANSDAIIWFNLTEIGTMASGQGLIGIEKNSSGLVSAYMNGSFSASASPTINVEQGNTTAFGTRVDFGTSFYNGLLQEVITYKTDNSANRTGIETNINDFYNIY